MSSRPVSRFWEAAALVVWWVVVIIACWAIASLRAEAGELPGVVAKAAIAGQATLGVVEMYATEACLQRRGCVEKNWFVPKGTSKDETIVRGLVKAGTLTVTTWVLLKVEKRNKWAAFGAAVGIGVLNGYLTARALDRYDPPGGPR